MSSLTKTTIMLMVVTIASKILGFVREIVLASMYGATFYSDAYLVALNIPNTIFATIGVALSTTFIPLYCEIESKNKNKTIDFTNNMLNIILVITIVVSILGVVFTEELIRLFAIGFEGETLTVAINFSRILMSATIFIAISEVLKSYLNANGEFKIPAIMISIPYNIIVILFIIISSKTSPYILAYGTLIAIASKFLLQLPYAYKLGYRYRKSINIKDEYIKKIIWLVGPILIGVSVNQINAVVDKNLASILGEGSISALNYASKLNGFVIALFISSIASVIYPRLSKLSTESNNDKFTEIVVTSINSIIISVIPLSVGAMVLAKPIVKILFQRGAFDSTATYMTATALIFYSIGMVAYGLRDILGKVFYSLQDTKTPMINGAIAMCMNIILNLILVKYLKIAGLALATSSSAIICILLLFNSLNRKIGYFGQDKIIKTTIKSLISSIIMGGVTYYIYNILSNILGVGFIQEVIALFGSIGTGAIIYGVLVILLKVEELKMITDIVKKKINA